MACNALENTIKQSITPTARRDTCSDAKESPFPTFVKEKVRATISLNTARVKPPPSMAFPLGEGLDVACGGLDVASLGNGYS